MKKFLIVPVLLLLVASTATAAEFVAPSGKDGNVTISQSETRRNLYIAGANVTINGNVSGDLFAAGGMVSVSGTVEEDLNVGGGNININGSVGGDLRAGGGNIILNSPIGGDILVGGGNVSVSEKATVGGDFVAGSGNISLDAPINGNVKIAGGNVFINSRINGTVEVMAGERLTFGPRAVVEGRIVYRGPLEAQIQEGAQVSNIEYTQTARKNAGKAFLAFFTIAYFIKLIAMFLAAWLLIYLWPRRTQSVVTDSTNDFLKNLAIGILFGIVTPIISVLLMITGVGFLIGLLLLAIFALTLLLACILTPLFVGSLVWSWVKKTEPVVNWKTALLGVVISSIIGWIPFIGWLVCLILFLAVTGTIVAHLYHRRKQEVA